MSLVYKSVPLDLATSPNIRLLQVLQHSLLGSSAPVECRLCVVSLDDPPPYQALSYTWGDPATTNTITLNGTPFAVRENLCNFLNRWRQALQPMVLHIDQEPDGSGPWNTEENKIHTDCTPPPALRRFLWIDAICINQESIPERNHQVGMMGRIYSTATSVIVWLGLGNAVIEQTMKDWHKLDFDTTLYDSQGYIDGFNRKQNLTMCMNAIQQLCSQDYWKRMWIVQEYTLAKKLQIWYGEGQIDQEDLAEVLSRTRGSGWGRPGSEDSIQARLTFVHMKSEAHPIWQTPARRIVQFKEEWLQQEGEKMSLINLIRYMGREMQCADVRDRVYALLSLSHSVRKQNESLITPDYARTPSEVFEAVCQALYENIPYEGTIAIGVAMRRLAETLRLHPDDQVVRSAQRKIEEASLVGQPRWPPKSKRSIPK